MTLVLPVRADPGLSVAWRRHGVALASVAAILLALFRHDAAAMATTWWTSTTFQHCLVIVLVIGWLVWQRRGELARLEPAGWWPGLAIVALGGVAWLMGAAGAVTFARELGLVVMLQGAAIALLGPHVARGLAFPLGYALFLVPFGEWMEGPLQAVTVALALPLLHAVGVAATANGVVIHAGRYWFEVAEACSGAKFVIAMVAMGVLVCALCFNGWRRRAAFLAACVAVPVLANGVRAAATMWLANLTSVEAAAGFDHIVYGWVWFGVVMAATLAIGWRWFDRPPDTRAFEPAALAAPARNRLALAPAAALTVAVAAGFALWGALAEARATPLPARLALPAVPGWHLVALDRRAAWSPYHPGADRRLIGHYVDAAGDSVDLAVAVYAGQGDGRSLLAYGTGAVAEPWWRVADLPPIAGGRAVLIAAPGNAQRVVATRYLVGGRGRASPAAVKLETLRAHLFGGSQTAVAVHLSAPVAPRHDPTAAIMHFAAAMPAPLVAR